MIKRRARAIAEIGAGTLLSRGSEDYGGASEGRRALAARRAPGQKHVRGRTQAKRGARIPAQRTHSLARGWGRRPPHAVPARCRRGGSVDGEADAPSFAASSSSDSATLPMSGLDAASAAQPVDKPRREETPFTQPAAAPAQAAPTGGDESAQLGGPGLAQRAASASAANLRREGGDDS